MQQESTLTENINLSALPAATAVNAGVEAPASSRALHWTPLLIVKLVLAALFSLSFIAAYALLPLASLGFLPAFFVYVSLISSLLEELGLRP